MALSTKNSLLTRKEFHRVGILVKRKRMYTITDSAATKRTTYNLPLKGPQGRPTHPQQILQNINLPQKFDGDHKDSASLGFKCDKLIGEPKSQRWK